MWSIGSAGAARRRGAGRAATVVLLGCVAMFSAGPAAATHIGGDGCFGHDSSVADADDGMTVDTASQTYCPVSSGVPDFGGEVPGGAGAGGGALGAVPTRIDAGAGGAATGGNPLAVGAVLTGATTALAAVAARRRGRD